MSDKSFGDYTNRNIVKNPLLSTAVTGLSLEDLTHNAVLLPVTHSQESITRQDPQIGHQNVSLTPSNTGIPDENSIPIPSHAPHNVPKPNPAPRDAKEDDFDVNEYFARLQGTRYVSAPLNSSLKEDQPPAEENLEEINLNEPEPAPAEVQQSLTADIAQNFSQLPTVLPQVASAVFSSFSNMLYKSRDVTPDERPQEAQGQRPVGQEAHFQRPEEVGVPLMGMDEPAVPREVAPPPREPPVGGTTSYRITTKKKAYAQIPGLSSQIPPQSMSDPAQSFQQPPTNAPPFFTPDAINIPQPSVDTHDNVQTQQAPRDYNIFNPIETHVDNTQPANMEPTFYSVNPVEPEKKPDIPQEPLVPPNTLDSGVPIITPPPMFSNAGRRSYPVGSAILPPSVARRICSQHPAKRQIIHAPAFPANNIFIPAPISDNVLQNAAASDFNRPPEVSRSEDSVTQDPAPVPNLPSAFVQFKSTYSTISSMHAPFSEARLNDMNPRPFSHGRGVMPPPPDARLLTPPPSATRLQSPNQPPRMPSPSQIQPPFFNPANLSSSLSAVNAPRRLSIESAVASNTANISKMAPPMPFFNPTNKHSGVMPSGPTLDLTQKGSSPDTSFGIETTQAANIPPPTFFDPNTVQPNQSTESDSVTPQNIMDSYFDQKALSTESKPIPEPPKLSGALNYRMTKKRPQYYSGPIEGIGSISNYKKPVVPTLDTKAFDGALFTPDQPLAEHQAIPEQSTTPFDISKPAEMTSSYTPFAINSQINNQAQTYIQPDYDTAFDLSRQTTENFDPLNYEVPEQESRGFGIIGSLKSKLSSIDINKIQNSVTTFFDPAYNDTKKETTGNQEYMPYDYSQGPSVGFTSQESNLEIYVPDGDRNPGYNQSFNSENQYHNIYSSPRPGHLGSQTSYLPRHGSGHSHYEHVPKRAHHCHAHAFFQHPSIGHFRHSQDLGVVLPPPQADVIEDIPSARQAFEEAQRPIIQETNPNITNQESAVKTEKKVMSLTGAAAFTDNNFNTYNLFGTTANITPANIDNDDLTQMSLESSALSYFENQPFQPHTAPNNFGSQNVNFDISNNNQELIQESVINASLEDALDFAVDIIQPSILGGIKSSSDLFGLSTHANTDFIQNAFGCSFVKPESIEDISKEVEQVVDKTIGLVLNDDEMKDDIPTVDMAAVPLFGLSSILADKTKEITELEDSIQNVSLQDAKDLKTGLDSNTSASVFDTLSSTAQPPMDEETQGLSELNICETCREIDKPEDANVDDLTVKLIENITSPIQLSNPVAAALTETNTPVEDRTDFNAKQCAEISHITEETMETIQVQSANELLEDVEDITNANTSNYGWSREDTSLVNTEVLVDHNYTFQMDPNAIGFFGNNPMFFENIPNNASDELKAEFKNSHDDSPPVIPISIPSAPPAEDDDSKSDETGGLDVHSIEQDAKKDFPIYEEFVIEPSETDDDKIEYKEKEKCSDEPAQEVDSFTNRVERFKKMEETVDKHDDVFEAQNPVFELPPATSPAVTIASYFDTGNYAAEAHYRNSLSSPSSVPYSRSSPDAQVRLPPGFEDGYKRRLSGVPLQDIDTDLNVPPTIPDTSTQTPVVSTATYSNISNLAAPVTVSSTMEVRKQTPDKLPDFPSVFGRNHESGDSLASSIFGTAEDKKEITASLFSTPQSEKTEQKPLPDPISFFSTDQESTNVESTDSFNRLASYFQTPPKPDHAKSFFELSESQNHYRHALGDLNANCDRIAQNTRDVKDFFNRNDDKKILNIPSDVCSDNLQLIKDLTSVQNAVYPKDQVVRTINYFTVEYDNEDIKTKIKPGIKNDVTKDSNPKLEENDDNKNNDKIDNDDDVVMKIITKCAYCCSRDPRNVVTLNKVELDSVDFKFKKSMDSDNSECSKNSGGGGMEERTDDRRREVSVTFGPLDEENEGVAIATENRATSEYTPVRHHWFYRVDFEGKSIWRGFSANDNRALEEAFHSPDLTEETLVATDGGRFDVNVVGRLRIAVYWSDKPTNVRRCSWFYKGATDARYVPYTEPVAAKLEEEYRHGVTTGEWHRRLVLPSNESVVMHGPGVMVHFPQAAQDAFSSTPQSTMRPRVVRRGCDETEIEDPEPSSIDHLLLLCHGVGSACDMRFRSVEEVVDDFRSTSLQLLQSHYRNSYDKGVVNRIEVLPISWHATLHSGETGVDKRLAAITLGSIPKLRSFTNDTVLDVLFYTSPVFCQTIIDTVCAELNRIYRLFTRRNPHFAGRVSLGGHSLGSVILYDLLCHQAQAQEQPPPDADRKSFVSGAAGGGQPCVRYPALAFRPAALYALGSPIAMFECIRGVKSLGADFSLPTCKNFFNIFHPYDPIAYRIEPLINAQLGKVKPSLIPHHKGRKRMHLELKDTMARVGADLKQKLLESLKATWTSVWKTQPPPHDGQLEKVVEEEMEKEQLCDDSKDEENGDLGETPGTTVSAGRLNDGRRVDYVLQEAPFEMINEYLFAMSSHVCYWESEDTMLLILREIYDALGVPPDCTVPQHTMTVQRARAAHPEDNETIVMNAAEHPSTSRGST